MSENATANGSCLCGAVHFVVDLPVKWCAHCHCRLCRKAHGAAFVTWFGVADSAFRLTMEEDLVSWYQSTPEARRGFCSRCGSTMFFQSSRWADEMHVALPFMHGAVGRGPTAHVYWDRHVDWVDLSDDLKRLGGETGTEAI